MTSLQSLFILHNLSPTLVLESPTKLHQLICSSNIWLRTFSLVTETRVSLNDLNKLGFVHRSLHPPTASLRYMTYFTELILQLLIQNLTYDWDQTAFFMMRKGRNTCTKEGLAFSIISMNLPFTTYYSYSYEMTSSETEDKSRVSCLPPFDFLYAEILLFRLSLDSQLSEAGLQFTFKWNSGHIMRRQNAFLLNPLKVCFMN